MSNPPTETPVLMGATAIAAFLALSPRQVRHLIAKGTLPTFKLPSSSLVCARPETLRAWLADQEAASLSQRS